MVGSAKCIDAWSNGQNWSKCRQTKQINLSRITKNKKKTLDKTKRNKCVTKNKIIIFPMKTVCLTKRNNIRSYKIIKSKKKKFLTK